MDPIVARPLVQNEATPNGELDHDRNVVFDRLGLANAVIECVILPADRPVTGDQPPERYRDRRRRLPAAPVHQKTARSLSRVREKTHHR